MTHDEDAGLDEADVPEVIYALAELMHDNGIPTSTAIRMAAEMLREAMDDPFAYYEYVTLH
jgi:hypothetical protein